MAAVTRQIPLSNGLRPSTRVRESNGSSEHDKRRPTSRGQQRIQVVYGELIVLGYNGSLPKGDDGRHRSKFVLQRRRSPNGVKVVGQRDCVRPTEALKDKATHSIAMTLSREKTVVIDYDGDQSTDMFQIGRSSDPVIDFIVLDTVADCKSVKQSIVNQSTVSRYACRIVCDRDPPYTARLHAAGFDGQNRIVLGENATKWKRKDGMMDALTTNGVMLLRPDMGFEPSSKPGLWREVSVAGDIFTLRKSRSDRERGKPCTGNGESNILTDGCLIDVCGATLLWRSSISRSQTPSDSQVHDLKKKLNDSRPQCPVGLNTLQFPSVSNSAGGQEVTPYAYLKCGHVHGRHSWGVDVGGDFMRRTCPVCRQVGPYVQLRFGMESSFYLDTDSQTYSFVPCGHVASESTVKYWNRIPIPYGPDEQLVRCPFCIFPVMGDPGYVKLLWDK